MTQSDLSAETMVIRLNAVAGVFQYGYFELLQRMSLERGGPGPWLDEIEANLLAAAKSYESKPSVGDFETELEAVNAAVEAITNFFVSARAYLAQRPAG